jgi:hypothetical protein
VLWIDLILLVETKLTTKILSPADCRHLSFNANLSRFKRRDFGYQTSSSLDDRMLKYRVGTSLCAITALEVELHTKDYDDDWNRTYPRASNG